MIFLSFILDENIQNRLNQEWAKDISHADNVFNVNQFPNSSFKLDHYHPLDEVSN